MFQVSLFAELFNEMLMRDFGFTIYKALAAAPPKVEEEKKKKDPKEKDSKDKDSKDKKSDVSGLWMFVKKSWIRRDVL